MLISHFSNKNFVNWLSKKNSRILLNHLSNHFCLVSAKLGNNKAFEDYMEATARFMFNIVLLKASLIFCEQTCWSHNYKVLG